jgi:hypothetical protein
MHAVQRSNESRFSATRWPNQRSHLVVLELEVHIREDMASSKPDVDVLSY